MTDLGDLLGDVTGGPAPWDHQDRAFDWMKDREFSAFAAEQRTGKTKVVIGKAVRHHARGEITGLVVVAMPGDVHVNWVTDELPTHLPPGYPCRALAWSAARQATKAFQERFDDLLRYRGLAVLTVNGEAAITQNFRKALGRFLKVRKSIMAAIDEQTLVVKAPGTKRGKLVLALGRRPEVRFRVTMDGTPAGEGPFDLFAPYQFLQPGLLGAGTMAEFKAEYGVWTRGTVFDPKTQTTREYPVLEEYRNLDRLADLMAPHTFRVLRRDCFDMPDKVYVPRHRFALTPVQRRVYDSLRDEYRAELADGGLATAANVLTRYLRLQQVASNFWPAERGLAICPACCGDGCEACDDLGALEATFPARVIDPARNPRLDALEERLALRTGPVIVWCRFVHDVDQVLALCERLKLDPVRYDGATPPDAKLANRQAFQAGRSQALVGNPRAGGRGLKLSAADEVHYYSNDFPLLVRLQSEDRAEDPGQKVGTGIHDYEAEDTVDGLIVEALRNKRSVVDQIMREDSGRWL